MIKVLGKDTIDKIAAGEVVERPMSIVKELLENSIDSGASAITAEIKDGGISLIRVTDNGSGINKDEVKTAFLRHATGKIDDAEDLGHIMTLGFRGEALSSIAAVCRCEIITKTPEAVTAVRYIIEGGIEHSFEEIGAPDGTTMLVRDIFYNTPARRKFLKTASTEAAHIAELVEKLALSHSDIAFRLIINNQTRLQTSGDSNLKAVIYAIYGRDIASAILPVHEERDGICISGYIGKPEISRPNRNYENYFVNGRYIKSNTIAKAIEDAYEDRMMSRQFPFALLTMTIDPSAIDVNVHPTKMDVRFSDPMRVYDSVKRAVRMTLQSGMVVPRQRLQDSLAGTQSSVPNDVRSAASAPSAGHPGADRFNISPGTALHAQQPVFSEDRILYEDALAAQPATRLGQDSSYSAEVYHENIRRGEQLSLDLGEQRQTPAYTYIGQVFDTYIIIQMCDKMYIIDQHAAHEKIYYERFLAQYSKNSVVSQMLDPPMIVTLTDIEKQTVADHEELLLSMGYELEPFGEREYAIRSIPGMLPSVPKDELLLELIDALTAETDIKQASQAILERTATMACKAAIKGNHEVSPSEAKELLNELFLCDNPFNCPHGRPTMIEFTEADMEKRFKRVL